MGLEVQRPHLTTSTKSRDLTQMGDTRPYSRCARRSSLVRWCAVRYAEVRSRLRQAKVMGHPAIGHDAGALRAGPALGLLPTALPEAPAGHHPGKDQDNRENGASALMPSCAIALAAATPSS